LSGRNGFHNFQFKLHMYFVNSANMGTSKDPFLNQVCEFSILFGAELDAEVINCYKECCKKPYKFLDIKKEIKGTNSGGFEL
jgi:hypothetical protein